MSSAFLSAGKGTLVCPYITIHTNPELERENDVSTLVLGMTITGIVLRNLPGDWAIAAAIDSRLMSVLR